MSIHRCFAILLLSAVLPFTSLQAQPNSGSIQGTVSDPSGAIIAGATVQLQDPATGYKQIAITDANGQFQFNNVPFNPYHIDVTAQGFQPAKQDVPGDYQPVAASSISPVAAIPHLARGRRD